MQKKENKITSLFSILCPLSNMCFFIKKYSSLSLNFQDRTLLFSLSHSKNSSTTIIICKTKLKNINQDKQNDKNNKENKVVTKVMYHSWGGDVVVKYMVFNEGFGGEVCLCRCFIYELFSARCCVLTPLLILLLFLAFLLIMLLLFMGVLQSNRVYEIVLCGVVNGGRGKELLCLVGGAVRCMWLFSEGRTKRMWWKA